MYIYIYRGKGLRGCLEMLDVLRQWHNICVLKQTRTYFLFSIWFRKGLNKAFSFLISR